MKLEIDDASINELQIESVKKLHDRTRGAHEINIHVRKDGQDHYIEADWLKHMRVLP